VRKNREKEIFLYNVRIQYIKLNSIKKLLNWSLFFNKSYMLLNLYVIELITKDEKQKRRKSKIVV